MTKSGTKTARRVSLVAHAGPANDVDADTVEAIPDMPAEPENGNQEYKLSLECVWKDDRRMEQLATQMKWRLGEGGGEAMYSIGVADDGKSVGLSEDAMESSLAALRQLAEMNSASVFSVVRHKGRQGDCARVFLRRVLDGDFLDVRVSVIGNVDAGKSTLVGILTRGGLDNGRGSARSHVFRHIHEIESGRTSSISQHIMGVNNDGAIVTSRVQGGSTRQGTTKPGHPDTEGSITNETSTAVTSSHMVDLTWEQIVRRSSKIINFIDLCGHERYFKTTLTGMTGMMPDYSMVIVGANAGILRMTKEHVMCSLALKIPLIFVVTKVDIAPENILDQTLKGVKKILKSNMAQKMGVVVKTNEDVLRLIKAVADGVQRLVPIFLVSAVTGLNLELLRLFFSLLSPKRQTQDVTAPMEMHIDEVFPQVTGIGCVVSGTVLRGVCTTKSPQLVIGPDSSGHWKRITVKSMMKKRSFTQEIHTGQNGTLAIKGHKKDMQNFHPRRGMIVCDPALNPKAVWTFTASVLIMHHPTTIEVGYCPMIHCLTVRQSVRILEIDAPLIRNGDRATVTFKFLKHPEYLVPESRLLFREGRTKGIGIIKQLFYMDGTASGAPDPGPGPDTGPGSDPDTRASV